MCEVKNTLKEMLIFCFAFFKLIVLCDQKYSDRTGGIQETPGIWSLFLEPPQTYVHFSIIAFIMSYNDLYSIMMKKSGS